MTGCQTFFRVRNNLLRKFLTTPKKIINNSCHYSNKMVATTTEIAAVAMDNSTALLELAADVIAYGYQLSN
jgi:hypothetical protein